MTGRAVSGGILNSNNSLFALGTADGGGPGSMPTMVSPASKAYVRTPPVLTWKLPNGWSSSRVLLYGPGGRMSVGVRPAARAIGHPVAAWRSGSYRWQVVARRADGSVVTSAARTYRLAPRLGAWITSGRVTDGRKVHLRVGYASSEPTAKVRVVITARGRVVHSGRPVAHSSHVRGTGSPRRGWFGYTARLSRQLRAGERVTVEVRVTSGGTALTRRFRATGA
jgi:hypothetical protein